MGNRKSVQSASSVPSVILTVSGVKGEGSRAKAHDLESRMPSMVRITDLHGWWDFTDDVDLVVRLPAGEAGI